MFRATALAILTFLILGIASAQEANTSTTTQSSAASDPPAPIVRNTQALNLVSQSYQAMTGMTVLQDATLQASAASVEGPDEVLGSATLAAKGNQQGRVVLNLTNGQRQEVRNAVDGPQCAWAGPDGIWYASAQQNCWIDASWFFPAFTLQGVLNDTTVSVIYSGPETYAGAAAVHLILYRTVSPSPVATIKLIQKLSTVDLFLDAGSGLPLGIRFNTHPDNNALVDLSVEIRFSNYKQVNGVQVPMRITKFLQGSLLLDLNVSSVQINSGLTDSNFALPAITGTTYSSTTSGGGR